MGWERRGEPRVAYPLMSCLPACPPVRAWADQPLLALAGAAIMRALELLRIARVGGGTDGGQG